MYKILVLCSVLIGCAEVVRPVHASSNDTDRIAHLESKIDTLSTMLSTVIKTANERTDLMVQYKSCNKQCSRIAQYYSPPTPESVKRVRACYDSCEKYEPEDYQGC